VGYLKAALIMSHWRVEIQPSLAGLCWVVAIVPVVETAGYYQSSPLATFVTSLDYLDRRDFIFAAVDNGKTQGPSGLPALPRE
jgi:hypothetical protein